MSPWGDDEDGGLQFERTTLAWWRTMLATIAVALLIIRQSDAGAERWVAGLGGGAALAITLAVGLMRMTQLQRRSPADIRPGRGAAIGVAGTVTVMQLIALLLV